MTLREITLRLKEGGVPDPETDARLLLTHFFDLSPAMLLADPSRDFQSDALEAALARRLQREPLQYILGKTCFFKESYLISPDCLAPRSDTEILVAYAIEHLPKGVTFADFCTGSGCIALSVLAHRPDLSAVAVDLSEGALRIARKNAEALGLSDRIRFYHLDLLEDALPLPLPDFVLSNPPYIPAAVLPTLSPEVKKEPQMALCGGEDGLLFYRTFLTRFHPRAFFFEIGFDQRDALLALGEDAHYHVSFHNDLGGNVRLAVLEK